MSTKTLKSVSQRLRVTKKGKILRRRMHLGHSKAKETGKMTRQKRKDVSATKNAQLVKAVKKYI